MSDIFISYAREDKERADLIAQALQKHGWSVWWDRKIPIGKSFEEVIETEIGSAKCVMVLWSQHSVKSHWVREEANDGQTRNILAPILLDEIPIPLGFKRIQAANFINWVGDANDAVFINLVNDIKSLIGTDKTNTENISAGEPKPAIKIEEEKPTVAVNQSESKTGYTSATNQVKNNLLYFTEVYYHTGETKVNNSFEEGQLIINSDSIQYISASFKTVITNVLHIYFQKIAEGFAYNYMIVEYQDGNKIEKAMFSIYSFWGGEPTKTMYLKVYELFTNHQLPFIKEMKPY